MQNDEMPERIWLIPDAGDDGEPLWCDDPAPGAGMDPDDAVEYLRRDLCASVQQVRALEWEDFEGRGAKATALLIASYLIALWSDGRFEISVSAPGYSTGFDGERFHPTLDAAKAAAQADYERRVLAALTPAPQAEATENYADPDSSARQPEGDTGPSVVCNGCGWEGGEDDLIATLDAEDGEPCRACPECRTDANLMDVLAQPSAATPTAQEAVPVGWITDKTLRTLQSGTSGIFRINHGKRVQPDCRVPLYAHTTQPSETVERVIDAVMKWENKLVRSDDDLKERNAAFAALRALKGGEA